MEIKGRGNTVANVMTDLFAWVFYKLKKKAGEMSLTDCEQLPFNRPTLYLFVIVIAVRSMRNKQWS
jgi:hypothetical protein